MLRRLLIGAAALLSLTAWRDSDLEWPMAGPMPDNPGHAAPNAYVPIGQGTRSFRPVEPLPWGDVNRRVAPAGALPQIPPAQPKPMPPEEKKP